MKRVNYRWTMGYNENMADNGFSEETNYEDFEGNDFTFADWLEDCCDMHNYVEDGDIIRITDEDGEYTGEAYMIIGETIVEVGDTYSDPEGDWVITEVDVDNRKVTVESERGEFVVPLNEVIYFKNHGLH